MRYRVTVAAGATLLAAVTAVPAGAQIASTSPQTVSSTGWSFSLAPYIWLPTMRSQLNYTTPQGNTLTANTDAGPGDYISDVNFAAAAAGEARYGRFSVLTDILYSNLSLTTNNSRVTQVNPGSGPIRIPRELELSTGTRFSAAIWTLEGGYTVLQGDWGNVDVVGGLRLLAVGSTLNYTLAADITLPNQSLALSRTGSEQSGADFWDGVGGVRGRINIPNTELFVPFYADLGGGGVPLTWQVYAGLGYRTSIADLSIGYRYLAFENGGNSKVNKLTLGGVLLAAAFHF